MTSAMQKRACARRNSGVCTETWIRHDVQRWLDGHAETGYGSFGNGAAMRVSYIAYHFDTLEKVEEEAKNSAMCTHKP